MNGEVCVNDVKVSGADELVTKAIQVQEPTASIAKPKVTGGFRDEDGRPAMIGGVKEYNEWADLGLSLRAEHEKNEGGIAWQAAHWLVDGYRTFLGPKASNQEKGRMIKEASRITGLSRNTLITYIKVGFAFKNGPIDPQLGFAHHRAVISILDPGDRAYWLRQAAAKQMSVSNLKQAIKPLVPVKQKLAVNEVQEAGHYASRLQKLNPKDGVWGHIVSDIGMGRSLDDYRQLHKEMSRSAEVLFRNLKQIESALAGRPPVPGTIQERIKPQELVEAEQLEAIGTAVGAAA
jgi:hypothetical protein